MPPHLALRLEALRPELLAFLRTRLGSGEAEDVVQTVMLKALEKSDSLRSPEALRGWLYQIARTSLVDHVRKTSRERPDDELELPAPEPKEHPCACAVALTSSLSPGQAELVRLVDLEDHSLKEAARTVGASVNAATVKLHRARKKLRAEVARHCDATDYASASSCDCDDSACA